MSNTFSNDIEVYVEGYNQIWRSGSELMDVRITLGQNERSSNCTVTLADPTGSIGADFIKHVESQGGIQKLPEPKNNTPNTNPSNTLTNAATFSKMTPHRRAWLDLIAWAEGTYDQPNNGYGTYFGFRQFKNFKDHPDLTGEVEYQGRSNASGRYQFMARDPATWEETKAKLGLPDFSPASQDKAAIYRTEFRGALGDVDRGDIPAALDKASYEWASFPPYRYPGQGTKTTQQCVDFFKQRLAFYQGNPVEATDKQTTTGDITSQGEDTFKGAKIIINCLDASFEFFHQGTRTGSDGKVTLTGQGIRWILARRKRSRTASMISLKELAQSVATAHKLTLEWTSPHDPKYEHISQQGISDYQLLVREAKLNGLFVGEDKGKLTVKSLQDLRDTAIVFMPGLNLIKWDVKDEALDDSKEDASSSLLQSEPKAEIEPTAGTLTQSKADVDPVKDKSVSGKTAAPPTGKLEPGQEAIAQNNRSRVARLKGLPTTLTVPLTKDTIKIRPMDAVRTEGLPGVLSRVWFVDLVTHNVIQGTTVVQVYSPVERVIESPGILQGTPGAVSSKGYIKPFQGAYPVTSPIGMRWGRMHHGVDIGLPEGVQTLAMKDGTVAIAQDDGTGYGKWVAINHSDGIQTRYAHLSSILVKVGQPVKQGQVIGLSGATGTGTGAHGHFEWRRGGETLKPQDVGLPPDTKGTMW